MSSYEVVEVVVEERGFDFIVFVVERVPVTWTETQTDVEGRQVEVEVVGREKRKREVFKSSDRSAANAVAREYERKAREDRHVD